MNHPVGLPNTFLEAKTVILKPEDLQEGKFLDVMKRREGGSLDHCPLMKFKTGLVPELDFKACTEVFEVNQKRHHQVQDTELLAVLELENSNVERREQISDFVERERQAGTGSLDEFNYKIKRGDLVFNYIESQPNYEQIIKYNPVKWNLALENNIQDKVFIIKHTLYMLILCIN